MDDTLYVEVLQFYSSARPWGGYLEAPQSMLHFVILCPPLTSNRIPMFLAIQGLLQKNMTVGVFTNRKKHNLKMTYLSTMILNNDSPFSWWPVYVFKRSQFFFHFQHSVMMISIDRFVFILRYSSELRGTVHRSKSTPHLHKIVNDKQLTITRKSTELNYFVALTFKSNKII